MVVKNLIFGATGQDGSYLIEHLLSLGEEVHGVVRRSSTPNTKNIDHLMNNPNIFNKTLFIHYGDITDPLNVSQLISYVLPDKIFNLAAQSHVKISFDIPYYTSNVDGLGTLNVLESCRIHSPKSKIYQASTSEMFGGQINEMPEKGFNENTPLHPRSPYGCAKIFSYWLTRNYREAYNTFACNGLLFNHSSPRRGENFLTRKVTMWCAKNYENIINNCLKEPLNLGNLNSFRDEGFSGDYVKAMNLILNQEQPSDYVISTGETHSIREWVEKCFKWMNLNLKWEGSGIDEIGLCNDQKVVVINKKYFRPSEVDYLLGDCTKAKTQLSWKPEYSFEMLIDSMMTNDFKENNVTKRI